MRSLLEEIRTTKLVFRSNANASLMSPVIIRGNYQRDYDVSKYNRSSNYMNSSTTDKQIMPIGMPYSSYVPAYLSSYTNKSYTRGITNSSDYLNKPYNTSLAPYSSHKSLDIKEISPKGTSSWVGSQTETNRSNQDFQTNYESKNCYSSNNIEKAHTQQVFQMFYLHAIYSFFHLIYMHATNNFC